MGQQPSDGNPVELIKEFKGLNDQNDSVKRPPGSVSTEQNIIDDPGLDASRRPGRLFSSLNDGNPIGLIYNLTWSDGSNSVMEVSGTDANYNSFTFPNDATVPSFLVDPCADNSTPPTDPTTGEPLCPPPGPTAAIYLPARKAPSPVPDYVPLIRALSEAYDFATLGAGLFPTLPNQTQSVDFYNRVNGVLVANGVRTKYEFDYWWNRGFAFRPHVGTLPISPTSPYENMLFDFYYVDYIVQGPIRYVSDLSTLINIYNNSILNLYLKTNPNLNPQTLSNYNAFDAYTFYPTLANYRQVCAQFAGVVNANLNRVKIQGIQSSLLSKTGTAVDSASCSDVDWSSIPSCLQISAIPSSVYAGCTAGNFPCRSASSPWNLQFTKDALNQYYQIPSGASINGALANNPSQTLTFLSCSVGQWKLFSSCTDHPGVPFDSVEAGFNGHKAASLDPTGVYTGSYYANCDDLTPISISFTISAC